MAYPESWTCPSCGSAVFNSVRCPTCGYQPPAESGALESMPLHENLLKERVIAFLIDIGFIIAIGTSLAAAVSLSLQSSLGKSFNDLMLLFIVPVNAVLLVFHPFYFLILEGIYSQTYGKKIMHLIVVNGERIGFRKSFIRNMARFLEAFLLYIPSIIKIRKEGVRWGDVLAGTRVIRE